MFDIELSTAGLKLYACCNKGGAAQLQQNRERWMELCEQIATEQDPDKFHEMVTELNRLLSEKDDRLKNISHVIAKEETKKS
jgi:hypothetical protein